MLRVSLGPLGRISSAGRAAAKIQVNVRGLYILLVVLVRIAVSHPFAPQVTTIRAVSTTETISAKRFSPTRRDQSTIKATTKEKDIVGSQEVVSENNTPSDGKAYFPATQEFDAPAVEGIELNDQSNTHDWSKSFHGLSTQPFSSEVAEVLMQPITADDIEIKPGRVLLTTDEKFLSKA
jgi:Mitochondrial genome maintenance MGM101